VETESTRHSGVVRALVVDDEPTAREAVATLLAEHPTVEVVG
jgi:DNA-binding NarL/FixJ family response regulator